MFIYGISAVDEEGDYVMRSNWVDEEEMRKNGQDMHENEMCGRPGGELIQTNLIESEKSPQSSSF